MTRVLCCLVLCFAMVLSAKPDRFGHMNPLHPTTLITTSSSAHLPIPAPVSCKAIPRCEQLWLLAQRSSLGMFIRTLLSAKSDYTPFLTELDNLNGAATMGCNTPPFWYICDCANNAKFAMHMLTGANTKFGIQSVNPIAVTFESDVQKTVQVSADELGRGNDVFDKMIVDIQVNSNEVYMFIESFCKPYHGFVLYKFAGVGAPEFLVLSAFASNYRLIDWMDDFANIPSRSVGYLAQAGMDTVSGGRIHGTTPKNVADITDWLTRYQALLSTLRPGTVLAPGGMEQTTYEGLWGHPDTLNTPVTETAGVKVYKANADLQKVPTDTFVTRVQELEARVCTDGDKKVSLKACTDGHREMPLTLN